MFIVLYLQLVVYCLLHSIVIPNSSPLYFYTFQATGYDGHKITTILHPMRKTDPEAALDSLTDTLELGFSIGFSMLFGMTILTASFSLFLIREQKSGAKHLQVVSGVGPFEFWTAAFSWDMVNFCVPCFVLVAILYGFQVWLQLSWCIITKPKL